MATTYIRNLGMLNKDLVLLPERYHPAREAKLLRAGSVRLGDIVTNVQETVSPMGKKNTGQFMVFDTSDAEEGFLKPRRETHNKSEIGSTKKLFRPGDVLISRLRPYLRQVAFVPKDIRGNSTTTLLACSTEFHVFRSKHPKRSIAFLVPFLLSESIQEVLSLSQEGGHHPRVNRDILMSLPIPNLILRRRDRISKKVEDASSNYLRAVEEVRGLIEEASKAFAVDADIQNKSGRRMAI